MLLRMRGDSGAAVNSILYVPCVVIAASENELRVTPYASPIKQQATIHKNNFERQPIYTMDDVLAT